MDDIFKYFNGADSKTLVIFDVDMVLIQPSDPAFQMANMKRYSTISKRIIKEVPEEKLMMFLSLMSISSAPILLDKHFPTYFQHLIENQIPAMGLTANLTGSFDAIQNMEEWRINSLKCLGIDFSKTAPHKTPILFDDLPSYRGNYSTYIKGILFVNGTVSSKGEAFLSFLKKTNFSPSKVIFIDDREDNLKSLEEAIKKHDRPMEYQGIHYVGAQKFPSKMISEEEFESQWMKLSSKAKGMQ